MKKILIIGAVVIAILLTNNCTEEKDENKTLCKNFECIEKNQNKKANIEGYFRKYTPYESGKGAGHMFWDWEILMSDSIAIPVVSENEKLDLSIYENKNVIINCNIFYGIIIGCPEGQNATGYRIDIDEIEEK